MLQITSNVLGKTDLGKIRKVDIHGLPKVQGKAPHEMQQQDLYAALKKLGVTRIEPMQGNRDLLFAYGVWLIEKSEAAA